MSDNDDGVSALADVVGGFCTFGALLALLVACTAAPTTSADILPPVREYSADFQAEFVEQYSQVPAGSALDLFVLDAVALRCAVRAARGDPVPETCRGEE